MRIFKNYTQRRVVVIRQPTGLGQVRLPFLPLPVIETTQTGKNLPVLRGLPR